MWSVFHTDQSHLISIDIPNMDQTFSNEMVKFSHRKLQELDNIMRTLNEAPVSYREAPVMMGPGGFCGRMDAFKTYVQRVRIGIGSSGASLIRDFVKVHINLPGKIATKGRWVAHSQVS